ncbi:MAG: hypothetical protein WA977_03800 [Halobacteriota archaeon]
MQGAIDFAVLRSEAELEQRSKWWSGVRGAECPTCGGKGRQKV